MTNVAKVAIRWRQADVTDIVSTFHVQRVDSGDPFDDEDLAKAIHAVEVWWDVQLDPEVGVPARGVYESQVEITGVEAQRIQPTLSAVLDAPGDLGAGQSIGNTPTPPQCAYLVGLRTSLETRRGRGRFYLPCYDFGTATVVWWSGFLEEHAQELLGLQAARLAQCIRFAFDEDPPVVLAVYSRADGDARAVTHFEIPDRIATQRRRAFEPRGSLTVGLSGEPE